jgi:hypothetical protein
MVEHEQAGGVAGRLALAKDELGHTRHHGGL